MTKKRNYKCFIDILFIMFIFAVCLWNLEDFNRVKIIDDEFGYWGIAARAAGYDWSDLMAVTQYYSFGYSIVLVPLFLLNRLGVAMPVVYRLAIIMNAFFMAGAYLLIQYTARKTLKVVQEFIQPVSLFITLYIGNASRTNAAWTESYIFFMFWCILALFINFMEKPSYKNILGLLAATANIFAIHMRAAGVVIAVGMVLILYLICNWKKINKKHVICILLTAAAMVIIMAVVKDFVTTQIYLNTEGDSVNDISRQVTRTKSLLSIWGLIDLSFSAISKLYAVSAASFLMVMAGMVLSVCFLIKALADCIKQKGCTWQVKEWVILLTLLSFLGELMVSAIFKSFRYFSADVTRAAADSIIYSRYIDFVIGPMILLGIYAICHISQYYKQVIASALLFLLCTFVTQFQYNILIFYNEESTMGFRGTADPWSSLLYNGSMVSFAYYAAVISIIVFLLICLTSMIAAKKQLLLKLVLISISVSWGIWSISFGEEFTISKINKEKTVCTVENIIRTADSEMNIYLVADEFNEGFVDVKILQWLLADQSIHTCDVDELDNISMENTIFLTDSSHVRLNGKLSDRLDYIYDSGTITVFIDKDNNYHEELCKAAEKMMAFADPSENTINLESAATELAYMKRNGSLYYNYQASEGYMTGGMNVFPEDGIYEFTIDIRARECPSEGEIGYITIGDVSGSIQDTVMLKADEFNRQDRQQVKVQVQVREGNEPLVGLYTYGNAAIRVYGISYRKTAGNIILDSEETEEIKAVLAKASNQGKTVYVDSNNSSVSGFPEWEGLSLFYLPGQITGFKERFDEGCYIVEKTDDEVESIFRSKMQQLYETEHYIIFEESK